MPDRFVLHRARLQKGLDLSQISASTALSPVMAARIDAGRFEDLPAGVYARSYVRTFARAVGVPPEEAVAALQELLRPSEDPLPALAERAPKSPFEGLWTFLAQQARPYRELDRFLTERTVRRAAAASLDAVLLTSIGLGTIAAAAWISSVPVQRLLELAGLELAVMFSIPVGLYFMMLDGLRVPTVGKVVCVSGMATLRRRGVRIRHRAYGRHRTGRAPAATCRDAGRHDRRAEHLALRSAPARR